LTATLQLLEKGHRVTRCKSSLVLAENQQEKPNLVEEVVPPRRPGSSQ